MMDDSISQEQLDRLLEDAQYLQDEAEALKYVIDEVPYKESPPNDEPPIAEMLLLIDHAQLSYYRPVLQEAAKNPRPTDIDKFDDFRETFEPDEDKYNDIQKLLSKLAKHRAGVINTIRNISLIDWETTVYKEDRKLSLFEFIQEMIRFDRSQLKKIADLVMIYSSEKQNKRKIERRRSMQEQDQPEQNH